MVRAQQICIASEENLENREAKDLNKDDIWWEILTLILSSGFLRGLC